MTGDEQLSVGDQLLCIQNEGLKSVGTTLTITDLNGEFISFSSNGRVWEKKAKMRWYCYRHIPVEGANTHE